MRQVLVIEVASALQEVIGAPTSALVRYPIGLLRVTFSGDDAKAESAQRRALMDACKTCWFLSPTYETSFLKTYLSLFLKTYLSLFLKTYEPWFPT